MSSNPILWSQRTRAELPGAMGAVNQAAILPVGATEQHGPHMGCGMDTVLADKLCECVSASTGVPMLPALPYGCSLGHSRRWPGTIALTPQVLIDVVKQIGDWAYHSGVRRLFLVNTHVTNAAPLRCALELLRSEHDAMMVALLNSAMLSARVREAHFADGAIGMQTTPRHLSCSRWRLTWCAKSWPHQAMIPTVLKIWCSHIRSIAQARTA